MLFWTVLDIWESFLIFLVYFMILEKWKPILYEVTSAHWIGLKTMRISWFDTVVQIYTKYFSFLTSIAPPRRKIKVLTLITTNTFHPIIEFSPCWALLSVGIFHHLLSPLINKWRFIIVNNPPSIREIANKHRSRVSVFWWWNVFRFRAW